MRFWKTTATLTPILVKEEITHSTGTVTSMISFCTIATMEIISGQALVVLITKRIHLQLSVLCVHQLRRNVLGH
jgi:hypothetical protein